MQNATKKSANVKNLTETCEWQVNTHCFTSSQTLRTCQKAPATHPSSSSLPLANIVAHVCVCVSMELLFSSKFFFFGAQWIPIENTQFPPIYLSTKKFWNIEDNPPLLFNRSEPAKSTRNSFPTKTLPSSSSSSSSSNNQTQSSDQCMSSWIWVFCWVSMINTHHNRWVCTWEASWLVFISILHGCNLFLHPQLVEETK